MKPSRKISRFLILAAFVAVFVSCNGFFNKPDNPKQNKAEAGFTYVRILAESQSAARTVMPQDYNPTAETLTNYELTTTFKAGDSDVEDAENSRSGLSYGDLAKIQLKLRNDKEYAFTLKAEYKGSSWSGTDTWSSEDPKEMLVFVLSQSMEGTGTLSLNADVSAAGISTSIKTVKIWISDERSIDRNVQTPAKIFNYDETNPCPEHIEYSGDVNPCGKRWILMEITDNYDLTTVVGPELAYVYPNETTSWTPVIEVLNKKYKITFSREGFEVNSNNGRADKNVKITANLVPEAEFPEPYVQGIYEATRDLPNYDNELEIQDLFLPPTGYYFYRWWDGERLQYDLPKGYEGGLPINGGTYTDDITLYPLWIKNGYIYNYSTKEEIEAYITAQSQDETYDIISIDFPEEFESSAVWNATISALNNSSLNQSDKKVSLNLAHLDIDWLEENVWFDRESPDESTTFASIAGTDEEPNTWLSVITLPQSRSKIPAFAFYNCTALESISIPTNYTEIGAKAFYNCSAMTTVNFNESSTFNPSKIQAIGDSAFIGTAITAISIPDSVTTIGASAFKDCAALETVTLANTSTLATIGESAFEKTSITQIFLRAKVATIGDSAFKNCTNLAKVSINSAAPLTSIGANAFEACSFTEVTIPNTVTTIGDSAFSGCTSLATVTIDSTASKLTTIGESAFEGCAFTTISLPSTITTLGGRAFAGNSNLSNDFFTQLGTDWWYHYDDNNKKLSAYFPGEVKFILNGESSEIPSTLVKAAPAEAIKASNLVSMVKVKTMESGSHFNLAFSGEIASVSDLAPLQELTVGAEGATIGLDLSQVTITGTGSDLALPEKFFAGYSNGSYSSNSIIYDDSNSLNPIGKVLKSISLPEGLESLGSYAIGCCPKLETVVIPKSVKSFGSSCAVYNNSLSSISFEENSNLTTLYTLALAYNPSLTRVGTGETSVLPESLENVYQQVFLYSGITEITIPDNAVFTSDKVFQECSKLKTVTIGAKVDKLEQCFQGCTSLETVTINGTESDWFCVTKEEELHVYNQTVEAMSSTDLQSKVNKENATYRDGKYYRNTTLKDVLSKTVTTMNSLSQTQYQSSTRYTTLNLTISVPFTSWETDLLSLKNISYANGSTSTTAIDLSGSTDNSPEKKIPDEFMKGKEWLSSFKMPQGTTTIGKQAFFGKDDNSNHYGNFKEFAFNSEITTIEEEAFMATYLNGTMMLPTTITSIGDRAFCRTMTLAVSFTPVADGWELQEIPDYCFFRSGSDNSFPLYIPASVTRIGKNAFVESIGSTRTVNFGDIAAYWVETYTGYDGTVKESSINTATLSSHIRLGKQNDEEDDTDDDWKVKWNDVNTTAYGKGESGNIKSYYWEKVPASMVFNLVGFTFADTHHIYTTTWETENLTYPLTRSFKSKSGTWTVDKDNSKLILSPQENLTSSDITNILKEIMFVIGPIGSDEFNPYIEGRNTNYILSSELPELLTPNSSVTNTLTQTIQTEVTSSDTTLFKAVTYVINLGTLNGEEVKLTQNYSQNSNIPYQYGWTVHGTAGDTKIYCEGYEGYGFPSKLSDLKADYGALVKTNAAGSINQASFDAPEKMIAGEGTIIWN